MSLSHSEARLEEELNYFESDSLAECAKRLDNQIESTLRKAFPQTTPTKIITHIVALISSGADMMLDEHLDYLTKSPGNLENSCFYYLKIYALTRRRAQRFIENDDAIRATSMLIAASFNIGKITELLENAHACVVPSYYLEQKLSIVRTAAEARHEKGKLAQKELSILIKKHAPENGWKNKSVAANNLQKPLFDYIKNNAIGLQEHALVDTIKRWMREIPEVSIAINSTLRKKSAPDNIN